MVWLYLVERRSLTGNFSSWDGGGWVLSILVVGSVALDSVETPAGRRECTLGGACTYFATAASLYARVATVGVVGTDFPQEHVDFMRSRNIDLRGLQVVDGRTFFWAGRYGADMGDAETLDTQLNVFADFRPEVPADLRAAEYVFLANIDPDLQIQVVSQMNKPKLIALDSMNYWIYSKKAALTRALSMVDVVLFTEGEIKQYTEDTNLFSAAQRMFDLGPKALVIKRGRHGSTLLTRDENGSLCFFFVPAYPLECVVDPTGAGDTFAAGFLGYLASVGGEPDLVHMRRALVHGAIVASFTIQDFSIDRLRTLTLAQIQERYDALRNMTHFA